MVALSGVDPGMACEMAAGGEGAIAGGADVLLFGGRGGLLGGLLGGRGGGELGLGAGGVGHVLGVVAVGELGVELRGGGMLGFCARHREGLDAIRRQSVIIWYCLSGWGAGWASGKGTNNTEFGQKIGAVMRSACVCLGSATCT